MVVVETVCDFSLALSYVGGPSMWVSETDHSDCICCHDMSGIVNPIYFFIPWRAAIWSSHIYTSAALKLGRLALFCPGYSSKMDKHTASQMNQEGKKYAALSVNNEVYNPHEPLHPHCVKVVIIQLLWEKEVEELDPSWSFLCDQLKPLEFPPACEPGFCTAGCNSRTGNISYKVKPYVLIQKWWSFSKGGLNHCMLLICEKIIWLKVTFYFDWNFV